MAGPMLTLTAAAIAQVRAALAAADDQNLALRAAARMTDGGIEYALGLDEPRDQDVEVLIDETITVLVSPPSAALLDATVIDFAEVEPGDPRFVFFRAEAAGPGEVAGN
jgi:iron-sulfur cluster assembly protein